MSGLNSGKKKAMILLQIYIDSDNWLITNLIRRYISSLNYIATGIQSKISYLCTSQYSKEYKDMKSTKQVNYCVYILLRVTANVLITFNIIGYEINHLMTMATHNTPIWPIISTLIWFQRKYHTAYYLIDILWNFSIV